MRFFLLNQFYPPDPAPTGQYLHDLAQVLRQRGHEVQVFCSRRSYDGTLAYPQREERSGVPIHRLWATGFGRRGFVGKLSDYASFCGSLLLAMLRPRQAPDLILALTTPPYLGLLSKLAARRFGCRRADWVMDLYPDVMFAHGLTRQNGFPRRFLEALSRFQWRGSQLLIALGPIMAQHVSKYSDPADQSPSIGWFPLWSDARLTPWPEGTPNPLRVSRGWSASETVFLYSGNMGLGHCFADFLQAAHRFGASGPRWAFCGDGKRKAEIAAFARVHSEARIELLGYVPKETLREHLSAADVHLMSLDPQWQGFIVPSKLQASFAVGRPVIYVGGRDCETAAWIEESGGGWVVARGDSTVLQAAIEQALDPEERLRRGRAAWEFAVRHFNKDAICTEMAELLEAKAARCAIAAPQLSAGPKYQSRPPILS